MTHTGASSPRLLHRSENFVSARNLATVSCKRRTTTRSGVKSTSLWAGTGSACVLFLSHIFAIWFHTPVFYQHVVSLQCKHDTNSPSHRVNAVRNQKVNPCVKLAPLRVFSRKHPLTFAREKDTPHNKDLE